MANPERSVNRFAEEHGDYKKVAHISRERNVTFYDKKIPDNIKSQIVSFAKTDNSSISISQPEQKIFSTAPAKYKVGQKVFYTNDNGIELGIRTILAVDSITWSESGYGYYMSESDSPWCPVKEENLSIPN